MERKIGGHINPHPSGECQVGLPYTVNQSRDGLLLYILLSGTALVEYCADKPCILSWPMVISGSVNEFFVAV
jgi:hypothetical protein